MVPLSEYNYHFIGQKHEVSILQSQLTDKTLGLRYANKQDDVTIAFLKKYFNKKILAFILTHIHRNGTEISTLCACACTCRSR